MKRWYLLAALVLAAIVVGSVSAATSDQGRRLAGPFCVGKRNLLPLGQRVDARLAILRAGVVRSVARTQACRPWEDRKLGLAWPGTVGVGPAGPAGPVGPAGPPGASVKGDRGERGERGEAGSGIGDGSRWICAHGRPTDDGTNGGPLFDGGTSAAPDCKGGAKFAFRVVTAGGVVTNP